MVQKPRKCRRDTVRSWLLTPSLSTKFSSPNPKQINTTHFLFDSRVPLCLEKQNKYILIFSLFFYTKVAMYTHNVYCVLHLEGKF